MKHKTRNTILAFALIGGLLFGFATLVVHGQEGVSPNQVQAMAPVTPKISPALRDLPQVAPERKLNREEINPLKNPGLFLPDFGLTGTNTKYQDPLAPMGWNQAANAPAPLSSFEGQGDFNMYTPPDTTGDVGPNYYIQMVNVNTAVYNKATGAQVGTWANNALWNGFGGPCENDNSGDPIVLYDDMAGRWVLTQFAVNSGQSMCFAISTTGDPLGTYYLYEFPMPDFPDYPKIGVWTDGYYLGTNTGYPNQYYAHVFERSAMLTGAPAGHQYVGGQANFLMPADVDGTTPPPAGAPGIFYTFYDGGYSNHPPGVDRLAFYEFDVDWATPSNSTFNLANEYPIAQFNYTVCGFFVQDCVPQPGTSNTLDTLSYWPMVRLQYRNLGAYQAMVGNFTVDVDGSDWAGIRWFEMQNTGSGWTLFQEGTWAPDANHRFMGSIAMDGSGNIALGYSITSNTVRPSIYYTVHERSDPPGTMQTEAVLQAGGGVQTSAHRWGDYSAMNVDPTDDCTFWMTSEYHDVDDAGYSWNTRIGSFRIPGCTGKLGTTGTLKGQVTDASTGNPIAGAQISATDGITRTGSAATNASGFYTTTLLAPATYTVTASAYGYRSDIADNVGVVSGTVTTQNFALTPAMTYTVIGTVTDVNTGWPLYASIDVSAPGFPGATLWTDPELGTYSIDLAEGVTYTFRVQAWVDGYNAVARDVGPLTGNTTEDFALDVDAVACIAPGYSFSGGISEDFEGAFPPAGWSASDNLTYGNVWDRNDALGQQNRTTGVGGSGYSAAAGPNSNGSASQWDTELYSPPIDMHGVTPQLTYASNFQDFAGAGEIWLDVSADNGATWTNLRHQSTDDPSSGTAETEDLSAYSNDTIILRWRYTDTDGSYAGWYWQIDNVKIPGPCVPAPGGLVVGNVYDGNTGDVLNGAEVTNDNGETAVAEATPDDANVDDAFYTIFSPAGSHIFTATMSGGYAPDVETPTVVQSDTIRQDFYLGAGLLLTDPDALHVTVDMGVTATLPLTLENSGTTVAAFELAEQDRGFQPTLLSAFAPGADVSRCASGGPDSFGYVYADSNEPLGPQYQWVDISATGTAVSLGDDESGGPFSIGFPFNYYGVDQTDFYINSNGFISFGSGSNSYSNQCPLPNTVAPNNLIALMWDDLDPGDTSDQVYYQSFPSCPYGGGACLVVQYENYHHYPGNGDIAGTFQAILFDYGSILIQFEDAGAEEGSGSTTGIENGDGTDGLSAVCDTASSLADNMAVCFAYPGEPQNCLPADVPWLSESPITGTVIAAGRQVINVAFDASVPEVTQPGDYLAQLRVKNDTPYSVPSIPVTMTVTAPPDWGKLEGTVTGLGYCDANPSPLEDAMVVITDTNGITYTLVTDANGYFTYWLDEAVSPVAISVDAGADYESGYADNVPITAGTTTTADFDLRWLQPCVSSTPDAMEVTLMPGYSTTLSLSINNGGPVASSFKLMEKPGGYITSSLVSIPAFTGELPEDTAPASMGRAPDAPVLDGNSSLDMAFPLAGEPAYAFDIYPGHNLVYIPDTTAPGTWNVVGSVSQFHPAGDFLNGDFSTLYALDYNSNEFVSIDTATAVRTVIASAPPLSGEMWSGMSGAVDGTLYAASANCGSRSTLYTINPATGAVTEIGEITGAPCIIDIAINADGDMYGVDIVNDSLIQIDPATGAGTVVGSLGVNANYAQGMDFEELTGILYWAAYTTQGELRIIDTSTGASTSVGSFSGGAEVDALAFATSAALDIPWLSENPVTGTVNADDVFVVDVTFDSMTYTIGTYTGTLRLRTDDPMTAIQEIPVTMHVTEYGVEIAPPTAAVTGTPGTVVTYTFTVTNTGRFTDTFDMTVSGNNWTSVVTTPVGPLRPGTSDTADVTVSIPVNAADGDMDSVTITATSRGSNVVHDTAILTTVARVSGYKIYLPLVMK